MKFTVACVDVLHYYNTVVTTSNQAAFLPFVAYWDLCCLVIWMIWGLAAGLTPPRPSLWLLSTQSVEKPRLRRTSKTRLSITHNTRWRVDQLASLSLGGQRGNSSDISRSKHTTIQHKKMAAQSSCSWQQSIHDEVYSRAAAGQTRQAIFEAALNKLNSLDLVGTLRQRRRLVKAWRARRWRVSAAPPPS
jgi:hypothetical protein